MAATQTQPLPGGLLQPTGQELETGAGTGNYCHACQDYFKQYFFNCDKCSMPKNWHTLDPKKRAPIEFYIRKKEEKDARIANSVNIYNNFKANQAAKAQGLVGFGTFKTFKAGQRSLRTQS